MIRPWDLLTFAVVVAGLYSVVWWLSSLAGAR